MLLRFDEQKMKMRPKCDFDYLFGFEEILFSEKINLLKITEKKL